MILELNKEYPVGTPIDPDVHGVHGSNGSLFTVITDGRTIYQNCKFEGFGSLFSNEFGQILTDVKFFMIQQKL